jgi:hypothetical protein
LNGAPHAITAGCYSADRSPSPIKTRVKATSRGGQEERKTEEESQGGTGEKKETLGTRKSHTAGKKKLGKTGGKKLKLNPDEKPETGESDRERNRGGREERNPKHKRHQLHFLVFLGTPYRKRAFPHQHLPKTTKTETSRERVGRT